MVRLKPFATPAHAPEGSSVRCVRREAVAAIASARIRQQSAACSSKMKVNAQGVAGNKASVSTRQGVERRRATGSHGSVRALRRCAPGKGDHRYKRENSGGGSLGRHGRMLLIDPVPTRGSGYGGTTLHATTSFKRIEESHLPPAKGQIRLRTTTASHNTPLECLSSPT